MSSIIVFLTENTRTKLRESYCGPVERLSHRMAFGITTASPLPLAIFDYKIVNQLLFLLPLHRKGIAEMIVMVVMGGGNGRRDGCCCGGNGGYGCRDGCCFSGGCGGGNGRRDGFCCCSSISRGRRHSCVCGGDRSGNEKMSDNSFTWVVWPDQRLYRTILASTE